MESTGPGATFPNIRRVYGFVGTEDGRQRVLLCREVDTNLDGLKDVFRSYDAQGDPTSELADRNFDGKIDSWTTFVRGRISKVATDDPGTGEPDQTRYYVSGALSRIERDTNHDGKTDVWEIYDAGRLQRIGVDLDFDGHVDRWDRDDELVRQAAAQEAVPAVEPTQAPAVNSRSLGEHARRR